mmetsp:Transcript_1864/g.1660  ORF Transcript_1864/g.1660 Transcript_1864/m.1660 type:complete len:174 (+) Transcript_1864:36-557(+)
MKFKRSCSYIENRIQSMNEKNTGGKFLTSKVQDFETPNQRREDSLKRIETVMNDIDKQYTNRNVIKDYINFEARSLSNLSIKKFQKQKIMKELLRAFPTIHQERKLTSLEKGRMTLQVLGDLQSNTRVGSNKNIGKSSYATLDPSLLPNAENGIKSTRFYRRNTIGITDDKII